MLDNTTASPAPLQLSPLQFLADARRVLACDVDRLPFINAEERRDIRIAKRAAWATLADVAEALVATLDIAAGDPDLEDGTDLEDEGLTQETIERLDTGPGCNLADPGEDEHDRELVDEREPECGF